MGLVFSLIWGKQRLLLVLSDFVKANLRFAFACDLVKANLKIIPFTFLCYYTRIQSYFGHKTKNLNVHVFTKGLVVE